MMIMKMVTFNNDGGGFEEDEYITCKEIVDHDGVILTMMMVMMMMKRCKTCRLAASTTAV